MYEEFKIAIAKGLKIIPIGATGYVAKELWKKVMDNYDDFYPNEQRVKKELLKLGDENTPDSELINSIINIINILNPL